MRGHVELVDVVERLSEAKTFSDIVAIVQSAARTLSGADGVSFVVRQGETCHYLDELAIAPLWKGSRFPMSSCISGWCMANRQTAVVPDINADARIPIDLYEPTFVKSLVMVPVGNSDPVAALGAYWAEKQTPTAETIATMEFLARACATAIVAASRQDMLSRRVHELAALYHFTDRLYRAESDSDVFEAALDAITDALQSERASILVFDENGVMRFAAARGLSTAYRAAVEGHTPWKPGERDPQPIFVTDIAETHEPQGIKDVIVAEGIRALAFIPLVADGGVIGKFMVYHRAPHAFSAEERSIAITIARQLGFSLARQRVETARREAERQLRESESRLDFALRSGRMGVWDWTIDSGRVIWSPSLELIHGLEEGTFGGSFADFKADIHPDDVNRVLERIDGSVRSGSKYSIVYRIRHPGGDVRWLESIGAPVRDAEGVVRKLVGICIDVTERKRFEEALRTSYDTFRYLVDHSPFGIYVVNADFKLVQMSLGAQRVFASVQPAIGCDFGEVIRTIWSSPFADEVIARFRHTLETGEPHHSPDTTQRRKDVDETESYDWKIERLTLPDGRYGVVCHFYDLTERQRHEEHVKLLLNEVNHRSKNLLAVVQAIANQTVRNLDAKSFAEQFTRRLRAIAAAQDLITESNWTDIDLGGLARSQLAHLKGFAGRITVEGPDLRIAPAAAQTIGLALHELATNALKHGALSTAQGWVALRWLCDGDPPDRSIRISWTEHDGPAVATPSRHGFGRTVLEKMTALALNAEVDLRFDGDGLSWNIQVAERMLTSPPPAAALH